MMRLEMNFGNVRAMAQVPSLIQSIGKRAIRYWTRILLRDINAQGQQTRRRYAENDATCFVSGKVSA